VVQTASRRASRGSRRSTLVGASGHTRRDRARTASILVLLGGGLGTVSAVWQTVDRIAYAGTPDVALLCDVNALFSCSTVFDHWQSSALGLPNSLVALPVFVGLAFTGLAGLLGSRLARGYIVVMFALGLLMAGFLTWYMQQSAFAIGVLCLLCLACALSVVVAGIGLTRMVADEHALGHGRVGREMSLMVSSGAYIVAWAGLALLIAVILLLGLG
jgi:uncharacterized membrane protein